MNEHARVGADGEHEHAKYEPEALRLVGVDHKRREKDLAYPWQEKQLEQADRGQRDALASHHQREIALKAVRHRLHKVEQEKGEKVHEFRVETKHIVVLSSIARNNEKRTHDRSDKKSTIRKSKKLIYSFLKVLCLCVC